MTRKQTGISALALGALGVVFGDIGTSPLYALSILFGPGSRDFATNSTNVYGVLSLLIWSVTIVVSIKYIAIIMRVDNSGEGGIMALSALIKKADFKRHKWWFLLLGIVGVSLFYGDGVITPSISILSAVEGLKVIDPNLSSFILPITIVVISLLFGLQRYGTALIGKLFGPIMLVWFVVIGLAGLAHVWQHPAVLIALSPLTAISFFVAHPVMGFLAMTAVVLAITGAETLYADMGHFGRKPIARAWFWLVFPALALCYMGQGAILLHNPQAVADPFFHLFPDFLFVPVVILATLATLVASQAVISGAFSLTRQAVQLGFLPSLAVLHTSDEEAGQVYLPFINGLFFIIVAGLVLAFGSSDALANAYGLAISGALLLDSVLFALILWKTKVLTKWLIVPALFLFIPLEVTFLGANLTKFMVGGWFPLTLAALIIIVITTWIKGERLVAKARQRLEGPLIDYVRHIKTLRLERASGYAVYIGHHAGYAPMALHTSVDQLRELHKKVIVLVVNIADVPHIPPEKRFNFDPLGSSHDHISYLELTYGYHDTPNVPRTLTALSEMNSELKINPDKVNYFVSLTKIVPSSVHAMTLWRRKLFLFMMRNRWSATDHYHLPAERTIDMEAVIEL